MSAIGSAQRFVAVGLIALALIAHWPAPGKVWPKMTTLSCNLLIQPAGGQEISLAFEVRNPGAGPVTVQYYRPYLDFNLTVRADDGEIPIVEPAFDTGIEPVSVTIAAGKTVRIETPIRLRFDPDVPQSGGDVLTLWSLQHAPVPVVLRATLQLEGATVDPCEARWVPT